MINLRNKLIGSLLEWSKNRTIENPNFKTFGIQM